MNRVTFAIRASGALLLAMLLLIGPGAGGEGGISGSGFLRGSIQRFGSIFVNDVHLTVAKADVSVDGVAADASDLRVGQQVIVTVDAPDPDDDSHDPLLPEAADVRYFSHVVAPVQAFNASSGTITALDQTIVTFTGTYVDGFDLDELKRNTWIRVSGQRSGASSLLATYIGPAEPGTVMLRGAVGEAARRFDLLVAGVPVEASALYGADDLEPGNEVWVSGHLLPRGTLIAERIEPLQVEIADHVSLQGILEAVGDGFALDGLPIQLLEDDETEFENGEADDLVAGARVEVEGQLVDGALAASKILFSPLRTVEAEGNIQLIDQVDPGNQTAVVKVLGVPFRLSSGTEFGNSDRKELNAESIDDLAVGDRVRIRAHLDGETVSVGRIDRLKPDDDAELIAIVSAKSQEPLTITLLGSEIVLSEETELRADERVDPVGFFDAAHVGDFVRVRWGDSADGSAAPDRMELLSD